MRMKLLAALSGFWTRSSLLRRFVLAGSAVLLLNMLATGFWVSERIADGVLRQSGINSAHFVESVLAPLIQELGNADRLSRGALRALEELTAAPPLKGRVVALKIWKRGGRVVYATDTELIGRVFEPSPSLKAAWQGQVATEFDELEAPESVAEAALGLPLVEIYAPVRAVWSGEVIAVFEFYEIADALRDEIAAARRNSWLLVAAVT
ncbi:MAG: two-component sensor histidine kinase, partial [Alphaproteobacteria bacterium]